MRELSTAEISPIVARVMSWAFVIFISLVPFVQISWELSQHRTPQVATLFTPIVDAARHGWSGRWGKVSQSARPVVTREFLHTFEENLERESVLKAFVQPRLQEFITASLRFGNHKSIVAADGWLFYQPGVDYLVGADIVDEAHLRALAKKLADKGGETRPQPDARVAITTLNEDLREYGIHLIVIPAPDKASVQPAELTTRMSLSSPVAPPRNVGYQRFTADLRRSGVDVFDPSPALVRRGEKRYLEQDTHWTPDFMSEVATQLAVHVRSAVQLPSAEGFASSLQDERVSRAGDLVDMLMLSSDQTVYRPQTVRIRKVIDQRTGKPLESDPNADILLIGDSYTNIYSDPEMGWGSNAGFAEHLAHQLHRPIDVIAFNGGGSSRARAELARTENAERLRRKKVVVYQFAERNLLGENWAVLPIVAPLRRNPPPMPQANTRLQQSSIPKPKATFDATSPVSGLHSAIRGSNGSTSDLTAKRGRASEPHQAVLSDPVAAKDPLRPSELSDTPFIVVGQIIQVSKIPAPGTVPYKDCLGYFKARIDNVVSGAPSDSELIVVFLVMKDNQWLAPATYTVGHRIRMTLIPLSKAGRQIRSMQRADDLGDWVHQPFYVVQETQP